MPNAANTSPVGLGAQPSLGSWEPLGEGTGKHHLLGASQTDRLSQVDTGAPPCPSLPVYLMAPSQLCNSPLARSSGVEKQPSSFSMSTFHSAKVCASWTTLSSVVPGKPMQVKLPRSS